MKGLLLKDWYMMKKYCRVYFFIAILFLLFSFWGNDNSFFVIYPCLLCSLMPINLLAFDERSRFLSYSATLPCTRAQIVSAKYLIGLLPQCVVFLATAVVQGVKMSGSGSFDRESFVSLILSMAVISLVAPTFTFPFIFWLGVEKGRMAYYVMAGLVFAVSAVVSGFLVTGSQIALQKLALPLAAILILVLYALSWRISIFLFQKRELG